LGGLRGLHRVAAALAGIAGAAVMMLAPGLASADSSSSLAVVGTSDMNDSGLIPDLIQPQFQAAFPGLTFKYTGSATGTAIQNAESGNGGPSVLIVHAASLENRFVAGGFSYRSQFGNAIFTNDFIFAGPTGDPAGVSANAANSIAQAFADVAAAGVAGNATFISRGGAATASGTTVAEHAIWALVSSAGLTPAGVTLCSVSAGDGGGMSPVNSGAAGSPCPDSGTVASPDNPSWYFINSGASQGANLVVTNACTVPSRPANSCYSLTDRATFDFLISKNSPAAPTGISALGIVTRDNSASAPGGANALINYFHAYIINPSAPGETVNLTAAQDFISFITSPTIQSELKGYLAGTPGDGGGPPFVADASPAITAAGLPATITAGKPVTVTGTITNLEPGFPALADQTVSIDELEGFSSVAVASAKTSATGGYSITFTPPSSGSYQASSGEISQVEDASLNPVYGDLLSPAATPATAVTVTASVSIAKATALAGGVSVTGAVSPTAPDANATVDVLARRHGSKGGFHTVGSLSLKTGAETYAVNGNLGSGKWQIETRYQDRGQFTTATSATRNLTVSGNIVTVSFQKVTIKHGRLTVRGTIGQPPATPGGKLKLLSLKNGRLRFTVVGKTSIGKGKTTFTIKAKLQRGSSYALQLQYIHKGQTSSFSKLKTIAVH
jgi:tungstate transport system substrate-binding protein